MKHPPDPIRHSINVDTLPPSSQKYILNTSTGKIKKLVGNGRYKEVVSGPITLDHSQRTVRGETCQEALFKTCLLKQIELWIYCIDVGASLVGDPFRRKVDDSQEGENIKK